MRYYKKWDVNTSLCNIEMKMDSKNNMEHKKYLVDYAIET